MYMYASNVYGASCLTQEFYVGCGCGAHLHILLILQQLILSFSTKPIGEVHGRKKTKSIELFIDPLTKPSDMVLDGYASTSTNKHGLPFKSI